MPYNENYTDATSFLLKTVVIKNEIGTYIHTYICRNNIVPNELHTGVLDKKLEMY